MEFSSGILVALLFVTILSLGIANILTALATALDRSSTLKSHAVSLAWLLLLLLVHLNLFWHTMDILTVEDWDFSGFVLIESGAIALFFATHLLLSKITEAASATDSIPSDTPGPSFFLIFAVVHLWLVGTDILLKGGFSTASGFDLVQCLVALALIASPNKKALVLGTVLAWALYLVALLSAGL